MKKRIISLILVVVMAVLALTGCAYKYEKDDMTNYATFDKTAFLEALNNLVVEEGDFGTVEADRQNKVTDSIFKELADKADADEKVTTGVPAKFDLYHYCYYVTATIDEKEVTFFLSNMKESGATKLQLGLSSLKDLNLKIADLVKDKDIKDFIYKTKTEDDEGKKLEAKQNDVVYVSYVKSYTVVEEVDGKEIEKEVEKTVAFEKVTLTADGKGTTFLDKLIGQTADASDYKFTVKETIDGKETDVEYSTVKINWFVESEKEIGTVTDKTYTSEKKVKDMFDKEYDLKDVELTYHIFPVHFTSVESELTADLVIKKLLAENITADSLPCFKDEDFKIDDATLEKIVGELADLAKEYKSTKDTYEKSKEAFEKLEKDYAKAEKENADGKDTILKNKEAAKLKMDEDKEKFDEADKKYNEKIDEIFKVEGIKDAIVKEYREKRYDSLENAYKNTLRDNLAKEIFKNAEKYIEYTKDGDSIVLPKKAVKEAYNRLMNNYKNDFYNGQYNSGSSQGTSTSEKISNYKYYNGDFDAFLRVAVGLKSDADMKDVKKVVMAKAEASVKELVLVYTIVDNIEEDLSVKKEQIEDFKKTYQYYFLKMQYGDGNYKQDIINAIQLDNLLDYLLEEEEVDEDEENTDETNKVVFNHIKYTVKEKDEDKKDKE